MGEFLGAAPGERTQGRNGYRAGYYGRSLVTRIGKLELRVPRDRSGEFSTALFERYARSKNALVAALAEMYVQGVSTRKVKAITEELCGHSFSPSPIAIGFPTDDGPVLVDVSTSITTNMLTNHLRKEGKRLPHHWLIDATGEPSDDPAVLHAQDKGTILPLGGLDAGHKGYGLALLVEALTAGLAGHGRADPLEPLGASVFLQILDPEAFNGGDAFRRQMGWVAQACLDNPPRPGFDRVRLPGQNGLARRERQLRDGVELEASILPALTPWAEKFGVHLPGVL